MTNDEEDVTRAQPLPPHETTASPVEVSVAMPRYFGVTPPTLLFGIAAATLAIAITLAILQHWVAAVCKQLFPLVAPGPMGLVFEAGPREWRVRWVPAPGLPQSLQPGTDRPRDLAAHFALALSERMGIRLAQEGEGLLAVIPRTP